MSDIIEPGTPVPDFRLKTEDGEDFTAEDLASGKTLLVFYPFAFSPVCTDQLQIYEEALPQLREQGITAVYGVSTDATWSQQAFKKQLGISIPQLSDFEPKGAASRAFGAFFEPAGMSNRALVGVSDGVVRWSHLAANPGELPGVNLIFDALATDWR